MGKKSIGILALAAVLAVGTMAYCWHFADSRIGEAVLTEETIAGSRTAADGLTAGFRADAADQFHWTSRFDFSTGQTASSFQMGEMAKKTDTSVYDEIRFNGWSTVPYETRLDYGPLDGLQEKKIQAFYDDAQQKAAGSGGEQKGKLRLQEYLDYYPVSFRFQFGTKIFDSDAALTGLKIYDAAGKLSAETGTDYDEDIGLYTALSSVLKIPVIDNEYQEYQIRGVEQYNPQTSLGYETEIEKPLGKGQDVYELDPILVIQEENVLDGRTWTHPDLSGGLSYGGGGDGRADDTYAGKSASAYNLKNRMLFVVNNRTAKGKPVDVSQLGQGYGIYELPVEVTATATVRNGKRSRTVPDPIPEIDQLKMVYPLDAEAEYVEMSLSADHRYLAVFSVKDGSYRVELIDADRWTSNGPMEVFPASENMTYAWGEDGTLALTNRQGYVAVLVRTETAEAPYEILYCGKTENDFDQVFFDAETAAKRNSRAVYQYGMDSGLAIAAKDGKAALVQSLPAGDPAYQIRNAALACAVIDESGILYWGSLKSNIVDLEYDLSDEEIRRIKDLQDSRAIEPVRNENWCRW